MAEGALELALESDESRNYFSSASPSPAGSAKRENVDQTSVRRDSPARKRTNPTLISSDRVEGKNMRWDFSGDETGL